MKVENIKSVTAQNYYSPKAVKKEVSNTNHTNSIQLQNVYYTPLNFTRRWSEHKSWGANIDPKTKNVTFKLFSYPDNQSVEVEVKNKKTGMTYVFPMEKTKDGIYESEPISPRYAKNGDSYSYIITKADGTTDKVKDPYSFCQKTLLGESVLYDNSLFKWNDEDWFKRNKKRVSRLANHKNHLTSVNNLRIYEFNTKTLTQEGTFEGAQKELERIKKLGFNAIEIMPVEATYSFNWGYDGVDKFAPSSHLGGPDGLKALIDKAHQVGLNVIMDMVPNHFGPDGNTIVKAGPYVKGPNAFGDAFNYEGENSTYVRDFIVNAALNWLDNYHCDGIRLDMTKYMDSDYTMKQIAAEVNYHMPEAFLIAEDGRSNIKVDRYGNYRDSRHALHDERVVNPLEEWEYGTKVPNDYMHLDAMEKFYSLSDDIKLGRLGYDSEWDFVFYHQLKETLYNNVDLDKLFDAMHQSQNRVKYVMSHDEIGNYDGTRLVSKLMVPMLSLNENIYLNSDDYERAGQLAELKHQSYDDALNTVKNQKAQLICEQLLKMLSEGEFDSYNTSEHGYYWLEPVQPEFIEEVLNLMEINPDSGICPEKISEMYYKSFSLCKTALALTYCTPGPKMVFQGDESLDITPFRFFREFQSIEDDNRNLFIEKGYDAGYQGIEESVLGNINYNSLAKNKTKEYELLTRDLNKLMQENPAMSDGYYVTSDTLKHYQSKLLATHICSKEYDNDLYTISNFQYSAYPRQDADKYYIRFPKGKWVEVLNTDDKKYGGNGYVNKKTIESDGNSDIPINIGKYSTLVFKKIG